MEISVPEAIGLIRANAAATEGEGQVSTELALVVVRALEDTLSESGVVHIKPQPVQAPVIDYDKIADAVVGRLDGMAAELVKKPAPEGMSPLPWRYNEMGCIHCGPKNDDEIEVADLWVSRDDRHEDGRAIVEAVNAYFLPTPKPPLPAEAATANAETQIPDTAGYPVPDYDAADVPSVENATAEDPVAEFRAAFKKAVYGVVASGQMDDLCRVGMCSAVSILGFGAGLTNDELTLAVERISAGAVTTILGIVADRPATQRPAA